ncbi:hypothetical protein KW805_01420 [Candidatus Pacearchaeota archaeon]|nr:hypothetical protein [Candidatus Pacearchaeota archaeon]
MGIKVEFNPDLALRKYHTEKRNDAECLPNKLEEGKEYHFLKKGQRNYWLEGEIPLVETQGNERLTRPLAAIRILEATHYIRNGEIWTKGKYKVIESYNSNDQTIHFEGLKRR